MGCGVGVARGRFPPRKMVGLAGADAIVFMFPRFGWGVRILSIQAHTTQTKTNEATGMLVFLFLLSVAGFGLEM